MNQIEKIVQIIWYSNNKITKSILVFLLPLSIIYYLLFTLRKKFISPKSFGTNIVCVGNCSVGGDGKTSTTLSILKLYKLRNKNVAVLLKGYKGRIKEPTLVIKNKHAAIDVGDEALLYTEHTNTFVSNDRLKGVSFIINNYSPDVILLDDGMQDFRIKKDKNILVINGARGFGNRLLLPMGPLRQLPSSAIKMADLVILIGNSFDTVFKSYESELNEKIFVNAEIRCEMNTLTNSYFAFSGIGNNQNFINTLKTNNYNLFKFKLFPDHYNYSNNDIDNIKQEAKENNLKIITTEKDWMRLSDQQRKNINFLPISIEFLHVEKINNILFAND